MHCPFCNYDNIEGVDQCARCQVDLTDIRRLQENDHSDIERTLLHTALEELSTKEYVEIAADTSIHQAINLMNEKGHHCAMVVEGDSVIGILTERDILQKYAHQYQGNANAPVREFMTSNPVSLRSEDPIVFGINRMMVGGYRHIPLQRDGKLTGMVSVRDVLRHMVEQINGPGHQ